MKGKDDGGGHQTSYRELWERLTPLYGEGEAHAIADRTLQGLFGLTKADALCGGVEALDDEATRLLEEAMGRLTKAEPVQYVLGRETFCGREFTVSHGVLIPRPETEELCRWIVSENEGRKGLSVLDIGTGSGCIAVTLALDMEGADATAWDIEPKAIATARENAERLGASVSVERKDALTATADGQEWDIIVSNPPYICERERAEMHANVVNHEPATALFVPDADPLLFYRKIGQYAAASLRQQGVLYFEINPTFAEEMKAMLGEMGFQRITTKRDEQGKVRMMRAEAPTQAAPRKMSGGVEAAYRRLAALCASAEHCRQEMREKMRRWQMGEEEQEEVIARLVEGRFIDEERYCRAFIADKIRYNKWGRRKIEQALMMKRIPQDIMRKSFDEVDEEEYMAVLRPLIEAKRRSVKAKNEYELNGKLMRFAIGRGFTMEEAREVIEAIG